MDRVGRALPPDTPGRPPVTIVSRADTPVRGKSLVDPQRRIAMLHSLAHIESYAIDLSW